MVAHGHLPAPIHMACSYDIVHYNPPPLRVSPSLISILRARVFALATCVAASALICSLRRLRLAPQPSPGDSLRCDDSTDRSGLSGAPPCQSCCQTVHSRGIRYSHTGKPLTCLCLFTSVVLRFPPAQGRCGLSVGVSRLTILRVRSAL